MSFFASLGNHDASPERFYPLFHMDGERYYRFIRSDVEFFALDSNYLDAAQLTWLKQSLAASTASLKIAFFHHPPYSSGGRHGSASDLRALLATDYSLQNTTRHALFPPTTREAKFKAKQAIDGLCWRRGDLLQAGVVSLGTRLAFGIREFALNEVFVCLWIRLVVGIYREHGRRTIVFEEDRKVA